MLASIKYWENKAREGHYAIPHFNVWNAEMLMGAMDAAEEAKAPVIISFGTGFVGNTSFEDFSHMMVSMAKAATVPVITHWDHGRSMEIVINAYEHGMNSIMRDASAYDLEKNIQLTKEVVDYFHMRGVPVEAELGHVGNETVYEETLAHYKYTDPSEAAEFVERTGCDSLAVAIGNQHGVYTAEPQLNFHVVEKVNEAVSVPIVLHKESKPFLLEVLYCNLAFYYCFSSVRSKLNSKSNSLITGVPPKAPFKRYFSNGISALTPFISAIV